MRILLDDATACAQARALRDYSASLPGVGRGGVGFIAETHVGGEIFRLGRARRVRVLRDVVEDRVGQRFAALAGQRRDFEHRAVPAEALRRTSLTRASRSSSGTMSSLFSTSQRGFSYSASSYLRSSLTIAFASATGSTASSNGARSTRCSSKPRALQVAQELVAEARAFRRAFDQAGNVGDHEALLGPDAHHAEIRCSVVNG